VAFLSRAGVSARIDSPIFFVGMPRSGTTLIFEAFAARRDVAWLSQHLARFPQAPALAFLSRLTEVSPSMRRSVSRSDQLRPWLERLRVGPVEAYGFWERCCGEKFLFDYLLGVEATAPERACVRSRVAAILRYQGKPRFAAKITGPGRIGYLASIFPDARFVHVLRDGRAVVRSLMRVHFWREQGRMTEPAWRNGLTADDRADWERHGSSAMGLAAVQWRRVIQLTRAEAKVIAPERYAEIHYERFVDQPGAVLDAVADFCDLPPAPEVERFLAARFELRDMNYQWREHFPPADVDALGELLDTALPTAGYRVEPPGLADDGAPLRRPFGGRAIKPLGSG
jgi:omega-hydroxy-beta-dihydromenaquinone-9 sulfotransferase